MYKTKFKNMNKSPVDYFDWETYFSPKKSASTVENMNFKEVVFTLRQNLKENKFRMSLVLNRMMTRLLKDMEPDNPHILELGAATGFLTRWMINQYGGKGVLVDKSKASYNAYTAVKDDLDKHITYLIADLFNLELKEHFDLVCSFGLIEHFENKEQVLEVHKKYLTQNGIILIIVPMDSFLTRTFLELHPELNRGYRELLTEKEIKDILVCNGLKVIRTEISKGYSYDFIGSVCRPGECKTKRNNF